MSIETRKPPERVNPQEIVIDLTPWLVAMMIVFIVSVIGMVIIARRKD